MRWYYKVRLRLRSPFRKKEADLDLSEELQFHLQSHIEQYVAQGMDPQEARHAAFLSLGSLEQVKEEFRDARQVNFIDSFVLADLRFALRTLRRSPVFTLVACLTLALGIGATTSIFSVVRAVIFAPLPFRQPKNLVHLWLSEGIVSYSVSQRRKEVGIRVALGATRSDVLRLILGETWRLALVGCMVGCFAAYVAGTLATSQSYIAPSVASSLAPEKMNPLAFVFSSMFLSGLAQAASWLPARRALRVDPIQALTHE